MRILVLGLDNSVLDKNSPLAKRTVEYGGLVEKYFIIAPAEESQDVRLSGSARAFGVKSGNKALGLFGIYHLAKKLIKQEEFDIITAQDQYYVGLIALRLARKFQLGLEMQVHGFEKYGGLRRLAAKYVIPRADAVRCVSRRLKQLLISEFGVREEMITVAPIFSDVGCRMSDVGNSIAESKDSGGKFIFLTVGRLAPVKNIGMQVQAMAGIVKDYPNVELWIAGDGPEKEKLKAKSRKPQAVNFVKLLGWRDDLKEYYSQADAFLLSSDYEGWGLAAIEAASYGLPIIMTDAGCAGEVIKNNESGIVIPVGDQEKLEKAMIELINNGDLRKRLGEKAREAVKKLPSKEETLNLYKKSWEKAKSNGELRINN